MEAFFIIFTLIATAAGFYAQGRIDGFNKAVKLEKDSFKDSPSQHVAELRKEAGI